MKINNVLNTKKKFLFGLIGKNIGYSISKNFFIKKFQKESINATYQVFDLPDIDHVNSVLKKSNIIGCNVTIPYKEKILCYLDKIEKKSNLIGSVNVILIKNGSKIGYNTDMIGFKYSFEKVISFVKENKKMLKALILGTGGVSKTVSFVLNQLGIQNQYVSRTKRKNIISYKDLNKNLIEKYKIIINCTPLGTYPNINNYPPIPYEYISKKHILYDLIYNPIKTHFLKNGEKKGAWIKNGLEMFYLQAEESWNIWKDQYYQQI